jgi:spermidine synthase
VDVTAAGRRVMAIAFFMGLAAAVSQVILVRELLAFCRGNELIIGVILSSWFLGIYLGARFNPAGDGQALERRVLVSLFMLPLAMAVSVYGARAVQVLLPRTVGTFYSFGAEMALALLFTAPVSFFIGFFFPPLVSLASAEMKDRAGGAVFYAESMGSFAGGMAFSFILVAIANPLAIASGLFMAALLLIAWRGNKQFLPLVLACLAVILVSGTIEKKIFTAVWNRTHTGKLVRYQRTKYQIVEIESTGDTVSVYGDGILMYTLPDRYEARGIFHFVNALLGERRTVLLMGSGPGSLLHNLLKTGISRLSYFEHDPDLWDAVYPFRKRMYRDDVPAKLRVVPGDLRHYLAESGERFDMIISLPPAPENIMLNRFYTRDFYALCKRRLAPGGIFVTSLHGFSDYLSADRKNYIASMYRAFAAEFPRHLRSSGETIYLAGAAEEGVLPESGEALIKRYERNMPLPAGRFEREMTDNFSPSEMRAYFERTQLDYFTAVMGPLVKTVNENRDLQPGAYWKNIVLSAFREGSAFHGLVRGFPLLLVIVAVLAGIALWDIGRKHGRRRLAAGFMIFSTGLVSISVMLVMIVLYQNAHGIVYYRISLINALFMLGLTLGSFAATRWERLGLTAILACLSGAAGAILASTWAGADFLFWGLLVIFSFLCGMVFPALFAAAGPGAPLESASVLDAMDHMGAIAGAILTVMVFLPLLGIRGTILLNMGIAVPALAVSCLMSMRKE